MLRRPDQNRGLSTRLIEQLGELTSFQSIRLQLREGASVRIIDEEDR